MEEIFSILNIFVVSGTLIYTIINNYLKNKKIYHLANVYYCDNIKDVSDSYIHTV